MNLKDLLSSDIPTALSNTIRELPDFNQVFTHPPFAKGPAADVFEHDKDLIVRMDLPGIDPEAIDLELQGTKLTISGNREPFTPEGDEVKIVTREAFQGAFTRDFTVSSRVNEADVKASFKSGVLMLVVAGGAEKPEPTKITITTD